MAAAAAAVPAQQVPVPAPAPIFALTPALVHHGILDYSTSEGNKIYKAATRALDKENQYNCEADGLRNFLGLVTDRAFANGWDTGILAIPDDVALPLGTSKNLVQHYGEIKLDHLRDFAQTFVFQQNRSAQDARQLYVCLMESLSSTGRTKIQIWRAQYTITQTGTTDVHAVCGNCLLKVIIRESHIDTNATTSHIRTQLSSLDLYLPTIGHDIDKFNQQVRGLVEQLAERGETTQDLLSNLFKGYKAASDKSFVAYINKKEEDYDEGTDIEPALLMTLAVNKFKILKQRDVWNAPSMDEEKILALEVEINKLKKKPHNPTSKKEGGSYSDKTRDTWRFVKPTDAEKGKPKTMNKKDWWWCPKHQAWCRHKAEDCKGRGATIDRKDSAKPSTEASTKQLKVAKALQAVTEENEDEEDDYDDDEE